MCSREHLAAGLSGKNIFMVVALTIYNGCPFTGTINCRGGDKKRGEALAEMRQIMGKVLKVPSEDNGRSQKGKRRLRGRRHSGPASASARDVVMKILGLGGQGRGPTVVVEP